jgi:hypothetical protein
MLQTAADALRAITPLHGTRLTDTFTFVMNGAQIEAKRSDAAGLSPAVALALSADACARTFTADDRKVSATAVSFFERFLSTSASAAPSDRSSLAFLRADGYRGEGHRRYRKWRIEG